MRTVVRFSVLLAAASFLFACNGASNIARDRLNSEGQHGFVVKTLKRGIWTRKYVLFIPYSYRPGTGQKYPAIMFLHGIGEGAGLGEGDQKNLTVGLGPAVARKAQNFDFFVIFPQSDGGWGPDSDYAHDAIVALDQTCREYPIDQDCVTLTGLSTGGAGTWAIGAKYHDRFSAIVPMGSNGSNQNDAPNLTRVAVRAYCSVFGDIFAGWNDQGMVNKIKQIDPNANAKFISTPTVGHDCWENVYGGDELYVWMRQQRRQGAVAAAPVVTPAPVPAFVPVAVTPAPQTVPVAAPAPKPAVVAPVPKPVSVKTVPVAAPRALVSEAPARPARVQAAPVQAAPVQEPASTPPAWINTPW